MKEPPVGELVAEIPEALELRQDNLRRLIRQHNQVVDGDALLLHEWASVAHAAAVDPGWERLVRLADAEVHVALLRPPRGAGQRVLKRRSRFRLLVWGVCLRRAGPDRCAGGVAESL